MKPLIDRFICLVEDLTDNIIAAGRLPIGPCLTITAEIVNDRPGIKDICVTEPVSVVPLAQLFVFFLSMVIGCHFLNFLSGKAKVRTVLPVEYGIDCQIVQTAENTLLSDTQNAGEEAEGQMLIVFKAAGKQVSHEEDDIVIKALHVALLDRSVVFVDDNDWGGTMMFMQHLGKDPERISKLRQGSFLFDDFSEIAFVRVRACPGCV